MREQQEHTFSTHDGVELFYRHWPATAATDGTPRKAILLFHRGHEHSGRIAHLVDELDLPAFDFFAWDARGHGQSLVSVATARASPPVPETCRPSVTTSAPPTPSKKKTSPSSPRALAR